MLTLLIIKSKSCQKYNLVMKEVISNMKVALIVINYNTYNLTIKCVDSILNNCSLDYEIILVDNKSTNDSYSVLYQKYKDYSKIKVIESPDNRGYSAGLNIGLDNCVLEEFDYYVFLNNDLLFNKGSLENLVRTFERVDNIGVVGGQIVDLNMNRQIGYKYLLTFKSHLLSMKPFYYFTKFRKKTDKYNYNNVLVFDGMVAGCCFAIPRKVMKQLGKFDEEMFIYFEEDALAHKVHNLGLKCALNPEALIVHLGSQTISSSAFTYYNRYKSAIYVLAKYCKAKKYQVTIIYWIYKISFLMKLSQGDSYKEYYLKFCDYYHKMILEVFR